MYIFFNNEGKDSCRYFSSESKAQEFVANNNPTVSLTDQEVEELGGKIGLLSVDFTAKTVSVDNNKVAKKQAEIATAQAQEYLDQTDFYFTIDKYAQLSEEAKQDLASKREAARVTIREAEAIIGN